MTVVSRISCLCDKFFFPFQSHPILLCIYVALTDKMTDKSVAYFQVILYQFRDLSFQINSYSASRDNCCTVGGDGGCRVGEVRAGTTSPCPTIRVLSYSN